MQIRREGLEEVQSTLADVVSKPDRTFKELSRQEKVRFIFDYYKWYILAGVILIAVAVSLINHYAFHNQAIQSYGVAVNVHAPGEKLEGMRDEYAAFSSMDTRKYQAVFEYSLYMGNENAAAGSSDYTTVMKLVTLIAAREVDYMFCDQYVFDEYSRSGGFADLSDVLPGEIYGALHGEGRIVSGTYYEDEEAPGEVYPMAIEITGLPFTEEHGFESSAGGPLYLVLVRNSKRLDEAVNIVRLVLGMEYVPPAAE